MKRIMGGILTIYRNKNLSTQLDNTHYIYLGNFAAKRISFAFCKRHFNHIFKSLDKISNDCPSCSF
jgi:hypothetical protein